MEKQVDMSMIFNALLNPLGAHGRMSDCPNVQMFDCPDDLLFRCATEGRMEASGCENYSLYGARFWYHESS